MPRSILVSLLAFGLAFAPHAAFAQAKPAKPAAAPPGPAAYATFVKGATVKPGLFPIVEKNGAVYLVIATAQLGVGFIETSVPASGLGGFGPAQGEPYVAPARILRFERYGDKIVLRWPNTDTYTRRSSPERVGVGSSLPNTVVAVTPVVAQDAQRVVISAAPFLGDLADLADYLKMSAAKKPTGAYHLDPSKSFFLATKAFPQNDLIRVDQTWTSMAPDLLDNAPDPRAVEVKMTYNLIAEPNDGYMPRIYDPRVGYFSQSLLDFARDGRMSRALHFITRWNFGPRTSSAPMRATHPMVFYMSNDIPMQYRTLVRSALLAWNAAYARVGILDAIVVKQQPNNPSWDPDDIRHNMVRWIDTSNPQFGAEALLLTDPRTGEELNVGVNFDAIMGLGGRLVYKYEVAPARGLPDTPALERAFADKDLRSVVMHESGHDMGLQHNFIGSMAYTAKDLQNSAFTRKYGIATSVMEYAPINLWPKGTPQGNYVQSVLGPYDYYAIHYGYGYIPGAKTPAAELPTLRRWASKWANPIYRFASDEDADGFAGGQSIDPRVAQFDLTDHPLAWCRTQLAMYHGVMNAVNARFPQQGMPYAQARAAFLMPMRSYIRCAVLPANTIGGEYLSRSLRGDAGAVAPLTAVPRAKEIAAWQQLASGLFSDAAWHFNPHVLTELTYSEVSSLDQDATWAYKPHKRHDVSVAQIAAGAQLATLHALFAPLRLQRIDDLASKYPAGSTMSMSDLFNWAQNGIFGSIAQGHAARDGLVRRNLQTMYAQLLAGMLTAPAPGTPSDAQALARIKLADLRHQCAIAAGRGGIDELTRGHLQQLAAIATAALQAHAMIAMPAMAHPMR